MQAKFVHLHSINLKNHVISPEQYPPSQANWHCLGGRDDPDVFCVGCERQVVGADLASHSSGVVAVFDSRAADGGLVFSIDGASAVGAKSATLAGHPRFDFVCHDGHEFLGFAIFAIG